MLRKLERFWARSDRERVLLIGALVLLPVAKFSLAVGGFNRTRKAFQIVFPIASRPLHGPSMEQRADAAMSSVRSAALNGVCRTRCLHESLVLWALLRREGLNPTLRFGARRREGAFEAHAWVELDSLRLDTGVDSAEAPFVPFGPSRG
jgi:hypothetical protein